MKASSVRNDRTRIEDHIRPMLGGRPIRTLKLADVESFQADIASGKTRKAARRKGRGATTRGGPGVAGRSVATLRAMLGHALRWGLIDRNPALGVRQIPIGKRDRRLSEDEIVALGAAMKQAADDGELPAGIAAVELMLLTGFRRMECLALRFAWMDGSCVRFPDTKTGKQTRIIGGHARALIHIQRTSDEQAFVFPSDRSEGHLIAVERVLRRLCAAAQIKDVTPHTLRHTFASVAGDLGFSEVTIAPLMGHAKQGVTQRYIHVDKALVAAADQVSAHIATLLAQAAGHWRGPEATKPPVKLEPAPVNAQAVEVEESLPATGLVDLKPLRTPAEYEAALSWCAAQIANPPPRGSAEAHRLEVLSLLIATYEEARTPSLGGSADALFRVMQSRNKTPSDLARLFGRDNASQLLSGARELSIDELRTMRSDWAVSPALLI
jgi:integrase/antitoxin component HigA of HigAB toxin-antitoxin module